MSKRVTTHTVGVHETTKQGRTFAPGDEVPSEYLKSLTNPAVFATDDDADDEPAPAPVPEPDSDVDALKKHYGKMKVDPLRDELEKRDLPTEGNKDDLVERLVAADLTPGT